MPHPEYDPKNLDLNLLGGLVDNPKTVRNQLIQQRQRDSLNPNVRAFLQGHGVWLDMAREQRVDWLNATPRRISSNLDLIWGMTPIVNWALPAATLAVAQTNYQITKANLEAIGQPVSLVNTILSFALEGLYSLVPSLVTNSKHEWIVTTDGSAIRTIAARELVDEAIRQEQTGLPHVGLRFQRTEEAERNAAAKVSQEELAALQAAQEEADRDAEAKAAQEEESARQEAIELGLGVDEAQSSSTATEDAARQEAIDLGFDVGTDAPAPAAPATAASAGTIDVGTALGMESSGISTANYDVDPPNADASFDAPDPGIDADIAAELDGLGIGY